MEGVVVWEWASRWARTAVRVARAAVAEGSAERRPPGPTMQDALESALREDAVEHKPTTHRTRAGLLRVLAKHWDLGRPLASFIRADAVALKAALSDKQPTFNGLRRWLRHVIHDAIHDGAHPGPNPFERVRDYPEAVRGVAFSSSEVSRILVEIENLRRSRGAAEQACDALLVLLGTGMRAMEVASLRWAEVDLENGIVALADSKTGARQFPISSQVQALLSRQRRIEGNPHVFPSTRSATGHIKPPRGPFAKVRRAAGLSEKATLHSLRATWLTHAVRTGQPKALAMKAIGDKSAKVVDRHYLALADEDLRATVEATAGDLLGGGGDV